MNISLAFGEQELFREVSFRIGPHDRIGLVGSNGAGKSTLLRILLGEIRPDGGEIARARGVSAGYLPQEGLRTEGRTLYAEAESVFGDVLQTQTRQEEVRRGLEELEVGSGEHSELLEIYGELQHKLEDADVFRMKSKIEKVLLGLGFSPADMRRQTGEFSGGWQMRIALARLLLTQPSLLLLDEPTNHLDLDSLQWLEEYLASYEGAVIIVSHDRRFLDTMTVRTLELSLGRLTDYAGNLSASLAEKARRHEQQAAAFRNQQEKIRQTERFIERFRYKATKARQVQSRIKMLEKMDPVEVEDEESEIHFTFPPAPRSGRTVLELAGICKSYGSLTLFRDLDFSVERGDRIAFVGVNGAGKSTLARILAGLEPADAGRRTEGPNAVLAYFAQDQADALDPSLDVLGTVDAVATGEIRRRLRSLLGSFLFRGDDVFKNVGVLSGGEKSRLALARMLLRPSNLLVMDEPTNHLDLRSKTVLQEALKAYDGSFVIVSHDRDFLEPLVTRVVEFAGGVLRAYPGSLEEYLLRKREAAPGPAPGMGKPAGEPSQARDRKRLEAEERQWRYRRTRPVAEQIARTEALIEAREREKAEVEERMADPGFYRLGEQVREITSRYEALRRELDDAYHRWNGQVKELERLQAEPYRGAGEGGR
ncbi:MAG: ABC-F family ATP-binding cassette domain-containing protein [Bacteroidota bacterium]